RWGASGRVGWSRGMVDLGYARGWGDANVLRGRRELAVVALEWRERWRCPMLTHDCGTVVKGAHGLGPGFSLGNLVTHRISEW
ncbi:MAG: hypothetical protein ABR971_13655, partial [Acidobacteriaceae bacterium]